MWVAHAPGMPGTFSPSPRVSDPDMHHGTCVTHVSWCTPGSLTSGFLWSRWRGKRSRHSRRMRNQQFYVSGKRPMPRQQSCRDMCKILHRSICKNLMRDSKFELSLPLPHNEHYSVSNYWRLDCLINRLFRRRSKQTSKLRVTGRWPVDSPHKGPVTRKMFPSDDVNMWCRNRMCNGPGTWNIILSATQQTCLCYRNELYVADLFENNHFLYLEL